MTTPMTPDMYVPDQIDELRARLAEAEETLRAIRSGEVDAITVSTPAGEVVYSLTSAEQPYREMIEAMSEGAVNITPDGMVLYCNQYFAHLIKADQHTIIGSGLVAHFVDHDRARITKVLQESLAGASRARAHLMTADGAAVPVNVAMHVVKDGGVRSIIVVTSDLRQMVAAQEATTRINLRLEQANRALHMLNLCNTLFIHATDERQMLTDTCNALVDSGGYQVAWIGYAEHDEANSVRPVAWTDGAPDDVGAVPGSWGDGDHGHGPTGTAIRTGRMTIVHDSDTIQTFGPWGEMAQPEGCRSLATIPLRIGDETFGAIAIYSNRPDAFCGQESMTLRELADDVAYCIANLRREAKLAETKAFLANILASSTKYAIIGVDSDREILFWNEGANRNYGYTADEIVGKAEDILHAPEDRTSGAVDQLVEAANKTGIAEGEFERVRKDGTRFPAQVVVTRRDDASGNPIGFLVISSDISEKRQAEAQLRAASQYARSLIEASLDPLMTINPDGKITDANHAAQMITGQPRDHLIGSDFAVYFTEPDKARAGYRRVFTKGFVIDYQLAFRHVSGTVTEVLYNASLYRDANGAVAGVYAAARDISRMPAADLMPSPRRRGGVLRYVGFAAAAIVFLVAASMVPMVLRNWLQQQQEQSSILRSTATNSRMKSLLLEVSPVPARVSAATVQLQAGTGLGLSYTSVYAVAAPKHHPGLIGKEELLSRFANETAVLASGSCVHLTQQLANETPDVSDFIMCPIAGTSHRLIGLLFMSWDHGDPAPASFDLALAATRQAATDISAIWTGDR